METLHFLAILLPTDFLVYLGTGGDWKTSNEFQGKNRMKIFTTCFKLQTSFLLCFSKTGTCHVSFLLWKYRISRERCQMVNKKVSGIDQGVFSDFRDWNLPCSLSNLNSDPKFPSHSVYAWPILQSPVIHMDSQLAALPLLHESSCFPSNPMPEQLWRRTSSDDNRSLSTKRRREWEKSQKLLIHP